MYWSCISRCASLRLAALGLLYQGDSQLQGGDLLQRLLLIGHTLWHYGATLLFPFTLIAPVHPVRTPLPIDAVGLWAQTLLVLACLGAVFYAAWRRRAAAWLLLMALLTLAPVANLLPLTIGDNFAHDRYLMLPVAFVALMLARALQMRTSAAAVLPVAVGALFAVWLVGAAATVALTVPHWRDNLSLWRWAYARHPDSQIAGVNFLQALAGAGSAQDEARVLQLAPRMLDYPAHRSAVQHTLAYALFRLGRLDAAEAEICRMLDHARNDDTLARYGVSEALNLLARIQMQQGRWHAAEANLREALRLTPALARPHYNLALLHYLRGDLASGDAELATATMHAAPEVVAAFRAGAAPVRAERRLEMPPLASAY